MLSIDGYDVRVSTAAAWRVVQREATAMAVV
jgi:hypothetical protein